MSKVLLFILDSDKLPFDLSWLQETEGATNELAVVAFDLELRDNLAADGIQCKHANQYCTEELWSKVSEKSTGWIKDWPDKKILNGKSLKESFVHQGCSLWWFGETQLFIAEGGVSASIHYIELFSYILNSEKPTKVYVCGKKDFRFNLLRGVARTSGIEFFSLEEQKKEAVNSGILGVGIWHLLAITSKLVWITGYRKTAAVIHDLIGHLKVTTKRVEHLRRVLILSPHGAHSRTYWLNNQKYIGDLYYRGTEEALRSDSQVELINVSLAAPRLGRPYFLFDLLEVIRGNSYTPIEKYRSLGSYVRQRGSINYFRKRWNEIARSPAFRESLLYNGIDLFPFLENHLKRLVMNSFSSGIQLMQLADNLLKKEKPDLILTMDETEPRGKALIVMAQKRGIPVAGFQHGVISSPPMLHISYYHRPGETWYSTKRIDALQCPIPLRTLLFGEYYQNMLMQYGYPKETLLVVGSARYDYLSRYNDNVTIEEAKKLDINYQGKNVLFLSSGGSARDFFVTQKEDVQMAREILKASGDDVDLIIKLHRIDNEANYLCLLGEFPKRRIKIFKKEDIATLIQCTSVIVCKLSAGIIEAAFLGKPSIMLNLINRFQLAPFAEEGFALAAYDQESLRDALDELLNETEKRQWLIASLERFAARFAYKVDGKASERVTDVLLRLVKE